MEGGGEREEDGGGELTFIVMSREDMVFGGRWPPRGVDEEDIF